MLAKCDMSSGVDACWPWVGARDRDGYGKAWHQGKSYRAHRLAYLLANGSIPAEMVVMHSCDNPPCVNPSHLSVGSVSDNNKDKAAKGRSARGDSHGLRLHPERVAHPVGEKHGAHRLTEGDVVAIRDERSRGVPLNVLADRFGVSFGTISKAALGKTWKHIQRQRITQNPNRRG